MLKRILHLYLSELELRLHGEVIFKLQLEVFPSKMDYKRDYEVICER
ncbi:hypothetical protein HMSSN139_08030 [Paenibacillus sp. HMSSN-139]|nr:hypothetical protein HMSSN139_08030 [Paenibacillus sp. HMSSN-139]